MSSESLPWMPPAALPTASTFLPTAVPVADWKLDHLGIAVADLARTCDFYERFCGAKRLGDEKVAEQQVRATFLRLGGGSGLTFELLEPTSDESPIARFLAKRGAGFHHVAFAVGDLQRELDRLSAAEVQLIDRQPRPGARGKKIAFLHPRSTGGVLLELCHIEQARS